MEGRGLYFRIGLLILGGAILLVGLIWFLGGARISHGILLESYFKESVQGLEVGAPVKYRGVTLGRVMDIGLVSAEYGDGEPTNLERQTYRLVFVRFIVDPTKLGPVPDTETAVKNGLRARVASQGITGLSYIELDFVDPKEYPPLQVPWEPKASYIPSMPSTFFQVQDAAQQLLAKINRIDLERLASQLTGLLTDVRTDLTTGDVHKTLLEVTSLLTTTKDNLRAADLPGLTADMKRTSASVRDTVQGPQMQKLLANAALAAERLANAADKLQPMIQTLQATARRANSGTADIEQSLIPVMRDIQAATANLRDVTDALRRSPAQVMFGSPPPRTEPGR